MTNDNNKNILKFSVKSDRNEKNKTEIRNFNGFDYIKTNKDVNGMPFIKTNLIEYSKDCKYMIRVMREKNNEIFLYNYYVPQEDLGKFLNKIEVGEFDGQVIEVEKYIPEDLA